MKVVSVLVARHLQIPNAPMAAPETDRSLPIGKACPHPTPCIQRRAIDLQPVCRNGDAPCGRYLAAVDRGRSRWRHLDICRGNLSGTAVQANPVAGEVVLTVGLT